MILKAKKANLSWLAEILELRKGLIICLAYKGRGVWKKFGVFHNSTQQLFLYYKISFLKNNNRLIKVGTYLLPICINSMNENIVFF